jgi:hypothetical protein
MDDDNVIFGVHGTPLVLVRSTTGDGGWSLHTPEAIAEADANDDLPEVLLSGPAEWDNGAEDWNRPNADDCAAAMAKINATA